MTTDECRSIKELFNTKFEGLEKIIEENCKSIDKKTDRIIESQNGKNKMLDNRITDVDKRHQKQADNHCPRIRALERKQAVITTKIAMVISGIIFTIIFAFDRVASYVDHLLTR